MAATDVNQRASAQREGAGRADDAATPRDPRAPRLAFLVVGIDASAGGLAAYSEFLRAVPADSGMAFVLVQQLPPDGERLRVELLAQQTRMPVLEAEDGQAVARDHVYVIRPGYTPTIADGRLRLGPSLAVGGDGRPVDDSFRSLAAEQQQRAAAVVFSGTGSHAEATSYNEELPGSTEEMQSRNEALVTVNAQLQAKLNALEASADDLSSLLTSTDIAVLFLDPAFRVRRFTPAVRDLLDLIPSDVGRPLADLRRKFNDPDMLSDAQDVLDRQIPVEREVASESGRTYLRRVLTYRTQDDRIDGVVVAFVDVTDRRRAEAAVRASEEHRRLILASAVDFAILTIADDRTITSWSPGAVVMFGYAEAEILGRPIDLLFTPEDREAGAPAQEHETARRTGRAEDERWHLRKDGSRFYASGVLTRLSSGGCVKVARDLTDRKRMEDELRQAHDRLEERVAARTAELAAAVHRLEAEMAHRRELARRLSNAQEDERLRLSRELHDTVGQSHVALSLALATARQRDGEEAAASLAYAARLAEGMARELHDVAVRLRPTTLDDLGLAAALRDLVGAWSRQHDAQIDWQMDLDGRLPVEIETTLYRLVQEALTNVARHARAANVRVAVTTKPGLVTAVVADDGVGFDPESVGPDRLGLRGMRERVGLIGGELGVESRPGAGTTIVVQIPREDEARDTRGPGSSP